MGYCKKCFKNLQLNFLAIYDYNQNNRTSNSSRSRNFFIIDLCGAGLPFSKFGKNKQRFDCPLKSLEFSIDFGKSSND